MYLKMLVYLYLFRNLFVYIRKMCSPSVFFTGVKTASCSTCFFIMQFLCRIWKIQKSILKLKHIYHHLEKTTINILILFLYVPSARKKLGLL